MSKAIAKDRLGSMTHLEMARWTAAVLTLAALSLCAVDSAGPWNAITTVAYLTVTGFAVMDGAGALPDRLGTRSYMWTLIVPVSIAVNVVAGTLLAAFGPGLSSCWLWAVAAVIVAAGMAASVIRRRPA
jgi:hypothetical protein